MGFFKSIFAAIASIFQSTATAAKSVLSDRGLLVALVIGRLKMELPSSKVRRVVSAIETVIAFAESGLDVVEIRRHLEAELLDHRLSVTEKLFLTTFIDNLCTDLNGVGSNAQMVDILRNVKSAIGA